MDIIFSFVGFYVVVRLMDHWLSARGYRGPVSDHFNGKVFLNYDADTAKELPPRRIGRKALLTWLLRRPKSDWVKKDLISTTVPRERVLGAELIVTFVNHATVLIQTEGLNILTDPIWSRRASPFPFFGPKRFRLPGIRFEDLPPIDVVLISHNHYDHMDLATLRRIKAKWDPKILVALGNKAYLEGKGLSSVYDMDWWDKIVLSEDLSVVASPAQHFSSRAFSDRNKTLWCGFVIETAHGHIYVAGDTGFGPFVDKLKERYQEFRLALLPIGAYKPEWFMSSVHISPDEAFRIHSLLNSSCSIGMHFGTFRLADDRQEEPSLRIRALNDEHTSDVNSFVTLKNGESMSVS